MVLVEPMVPAPSGTIGMSRVRLSGALAVMEMTGAISAMISTVVVSATLWPMEKKMLPEMRARRKEDRRTLSLPSIL